MRRTLWVWALVIGAALLASPSIVQAQGWLSDRSATQGPGFRLGDFELHPGLGLEIGYDNNLYYTQDGAPACGPMTMLGRPCWLDSAILRATAHVNINSRSGERQQEGEQHGGGEGGAAPPITFRGGLSGSFYHFFNATDRTNMEANAALAVSFLPGRPFSIDIAENFGRSIRPFTEQTLMRASYGRLTNDATVNFNFQTSGGVLLVRLGYALHLDFFEEGQFQYGNRLLHTISLSETFRFLPQTAIVHDTQVGVIDYLNGVSAMTPTQINDGATIRSRVGLNGAITNEISILGMVGYGAGFFSSPSATYVMNFESLVAQAELRWEITQGVRLAGGYDRDFQASYVGNFYRRDRGYLNYSMLIGGAFLLSAQVAFGYYEFGASVTPTLMMLGNSLFRGDFRFEGSLFGEYRFTDWLGVNATLQYTGNFTNYSYTIDPMGTTVIDPAQYNKVQLWLGARVFY